MKKFLAGLGILSLVLLVAAPVLAQSTDTASVAATVTPVTISVSVSDGDVDYGILDISESNDTLDGTAAETQTITSGSNVSTNITLKSSDATGTNVDWNLVSAATGVGADTFVHYYDIDGTAGSAVWTDFPDTNLYTGTVVTLASLGDTATMDLKIDMPTSISDATVHSIDVTVLATETP